MTYVDRVHYSRETNTMDFQSNNIMLRVFLCVIILLNEDVFLYVIILLNECTTCYENKIGTVKIIWLGKLIDGGG